MRLSQRVGWAVGALIALLVPTATAQQNGDARELPLRDIRGLVAHNATLDTVDHLGRNAVRLRRTTGDDGFAVVDGPAFQDGTIEVDVAAKVMVPPGVRMPGFIGVAFRARPDASGYELFYLRPGNARADDQAMRNHAVQYSAAPGFSWYQLRRAWPMVYEAYSDIDPDAWTRMKIEVAGRRAKLFLNGSEHPVLVVDGLKGEDLRGAVALWGFQNQESYFSNLRISYSTPEPVTNGSDVTGEWRTTLTTDVGPFTGQLLLQRDGTAVKGEWSGELGERLPVTGTWRNGYVELSFSGEWPKDRPGGPAPATVTLAGWFDGTSASGRVRIDGRAEGRWRATQKKGT